MSKHLLLLALLVGCTSAKEAFDDGGEDPALDAALPADAACDVDAQDDPMNCGSCGRACTHAGGCADGVCLGDYLELAVGGEFACARQGTGSVWCWGKAEGIGSTGASSTPVQIAVDDAVEISSGTDMACARRSNGELWCWGVTSLPSSGTGPITPPVQVALPDGIEVTQMAVAAIHACVMTSIGEVYCWGSNRDSELGGSSLASSASPILVEGLPSAVHIAAGGFHTCIVSTEQQVWCWGRNDNGELGDGSTMPSNVPVPAQTDALLVEVDAGGLHNCARGNVLGSLSSSVWCWGDNTHGELGIGSNAPSGLPVEWTPPALSHPVQIAAGTHRSCALGQIGVVECWGEDLHGELGDNAIADEWHGVMPSMLRNATAIDTGFDSTCAIDTLNGIWCWGHNNVGQIGDGSTGTDRLLPTRVNLPP